MIRSLLYLSSSNLTSEDRGGIEAIVATARARNAALDVTGALLSTETRFAQVLEGPADSVEAVLASISRDPRHQDVRVVIDQDLPERRFGRWAMAYSGPSLLVDRKLKRLLARPAKGPELGEALVAFMQDQLGQA